MYNYYPSHEAMHNALYGEHFWFGEGLFGLALLAIGIVLVVMLVRHLSSGSMLGAGAGEKDAMDILRERYARGEIGTAEFDERKKALTGK